MLRLLPITNSEKVKAICEKNSLEYVDGMFAYEAYDKVILGQAVGEIKEGVFTLSFISSENDIYIADGLIRAAANYALENGADRMILPETLGVQSADLFKLLKIDLQSMIFIDDFFKNSKTCLK